MTLGRVAAAALGAAVLVLGGCGFVGDDPAGGAAASGQTTSTVVITTLPPVRPTFPEVAPPTSEPGGPAAGGAATGGGGTGPGGTPVAAPPTTIVPGGPGWDRLTEPERVLVLTCIQVTAFTRSGGVAVLASIDRPAEARAPLEAMVAALDELVAVAPPQVAAEARPIGAALRAALTGDASPPSLFARMNAAAASQEFAINGLLATVSQLCPGQVPADTVQQGSLFRLGAPLPPGISGPFL